MNKLNKQKISTIPKVLATMVTLFLTMDVGASVSFPTILIAALTGRNNNTNPNETLHMTPIQASWLGVCCQSRLKYYQQNVKDASVAFLLISSYLWEKATDFL